MLKRTLLFGRKTRVTFVLPLDRPSGVVSVVGDFNNWCPGSHELLCRRDSTRTVSVILPPGVHRFRYLASGDVWFDDETADRIDHHGSLIHL
ncbi:MAG: glycoside hydrolase family 13 domain protein [Sphaerisporangium sp.]|jgi:hypothetical protein|nr:glycoside hydrolase family 13 domain protein [Sphaerisporangium sp.]